MRISLFTLILISAGAAKAQMPTIKQFEWSKATRGFEQNVRITADSVYVNTVDQKGSRGPARFQRKLDPKEWTELTAQINAVILKDMASLPSPTMNRASDQAMHSTLTITDVNNRTYVHGFDDENPNAALKPLLHVIKQVSGKKDRE